MKIRKFLYLAMALLLAFFLGYFVKDKKAVKENDIENSIQYSAPTTFLAMKNSVTEIYEAVGTVRPRTETKIEAQVAGKILSVYVKPGDFVKKGEQLIQLENNEFKTRLERAEQGLISAEASREQAKKMIEAAEARFNKAESDYNRVKKLLSDKAISTKDMEQAESVFLQAEAELKQYNQGLEASEAGVKQARNLVEEAQIAMTYTDIRASEDAEIARKLVEPGDIAVPGKTLLIVQTVGKMRLEAFVREGLIGKNTAR